MRPGYNEVQVPPEDQLLTEEVVVEIPVAPTEKLDAQVNDAIKSTVSKKIDMVKQLIDLVDSTVDVDTDLAKYDYTAKLIELGIPAGQHEIVAQKLVMLCKLKKDEKIRIAKCAGIRAAVVAGADAGTLISGVPFAKSVDDLDIKLIPDGFIVGLKDGINTNG
ncbi:MAG: hypothetical protein JEZ07_08935 [Phycisphaerae bacterium]|nr:hypothetical protein [Phycisphaerae bacterium]